MRMADTPAISEAGSMLPRSSSRCQALARAGLPETSEPTRSGSCPRTMLTATPVRKPIITECGTNRVKRPIRRAAAAIMTPPAIRVRRKRASDRRSAGTFATAEPAASAAALVVVMTISLLLEVSPPPTGPKMLA